MPEANVAARGPVVVRVLRLPHGHGLPLPDYQSELAAGMDLVAALPDGRPLRLEPGARALVPTGLVFEIPAGFEAQVRPRSGLAFKHGVTVLNSPGTIDADYRGEVQVLLVNLGKAAVDIARGERVAQLVIAPVTLATLVEVTQVDATQRGAGGFGSTGRGAKAAKVPKSRAKAAATRTSPAQTVKPPRKPSGRR
ncbi:MAG: dUTP diphosphatase [Hyphomicrobiaceae bacterium]|nr:dUTP diphosphatase [Hyphomicrobiaceae bacterium]